MGKIKVSDVRVREVQREDLDDYIKYFFESSPEFLNGIGMRKPEKGQAEAFRAWWEERFKERESGGAPIPVLTVFYRGVRIGVHPSTHQEPGRSLIMHAVRTSSTGPSSWGHCG